MLSISLRFAFKQIKGLEIQVKIDSTLCDGNKKKTMEYMVDTSRERRVKNRYFLHIFTEIYSQRSQYWCHHCLSVCVYDTICCTLNLLGMWCLRKSAYLDGAGTLPRSSCACLLCGVIYVYAALYDYVLINIHKWWAACVMWCEVHVSQIACVYAILEMCV